MRNRRLGGLVLVGVLLIAAPSASAADDKDLALIHYNAAVLHTQRGEHRQAAEEFEAAYSVSPQPNFLFNAAQAYRTLGNSGSHNDLRRALDLFRRFLVARPDAPNRRKIESAIAEIERHVGKQKPDAATEAARARFEEGARAYLAGDHAHALVEFQAAREIKPFPDLDYNIARCHDRLQQEREAIAAYERFLARASTKLGAPEIEESRHRIEELRRGLAAKEPPPPTPAQAAPPPKPVPTPSSSRPLLIGAAVGLPLALGLAGGGLGLYLSARADHEKWATGPEQCVPRCDKSAVLAAQSRERAGYALLGVGSALAVADVVLWVLWAQRRPAEHAVRLLPAPGGLFVAGEF